MIAFIERAQDPVLFEIFKTFAESHGTVINGDIIAVKGEWSEEFEANGVPHQRVYNIAFRASSPPTLISLKPEGTI